MINMDINKGVPPKLKEESSAAYKRFLLYYNSMPNRSVMNAYKRYLASNPTRKAQKSPKKPTIPGSWKADAKKFDWKIRAESWDIDMLSSQGKKAVINYIDILTILSRVTLSALIEDGIRPHDIGTVLSSIGTLTQNIDARAIAAVAVSGNNGARALPSGARAELTG